MNRNILIAGTAALLFAFNLGADEGHGARGGYQCDHSQGAGAEATARLQRAVDAMNAAEGEAKVEAMAAVINSWMEIHGQESSRSSHMGMGKGKGMGQGEGMGRGKMGRHAGGEGQGRMGQHGHNGSSSGEHGGAQKAEHRQ